MDKIIGIINDNLRSVINSIREHLDESKALLQKISKEMDSKVELAQKYKEDVSESKDKINNIEDEISSLENDLNELNEKFGNTDFKEILSAGNKEINTKIIEKRAVIQKESQKILNLTEKARVLKEELIDLKEKKNTLEKDIKKTSVAERFYSSKINGIIEYTEAGNDLELYVSSTPQMELLTNSDYEDELVEVSTTLNDHIFEEIDEITTQEPDASLVEEALKNAVKVTYVPNQPVNPAISFETVTAEPTVEEQPVEDKKEEPIEVISKKGFNPVVTTSLVKKEIIDTKPNIEDKIEEKNPVEIVKEQEIVSPLIAPKAPSIFDNVEKNVEVSPEKEEKTLSINDLIDKTLEKMDYPEFDESSIDLNMLEDDIEDEDDEPLLPGEENIINPLYEDDNDESVIEIDVEEDLNNINKDMFKERESTKGEDLKEIGIDISKLSVEDMNTLIKKSDKARLKKIISVFQKHGIDISNTYSNIKVLTDISSENIDEMLTILGNASKEDLSPIIPLLDKININALEQSIEINKDKPLIDIIVPSVTEVNDEIKEKLNMTEEEYETMKSSVSEEILKKINILSNRVVENYNTLNNLGISNIRECLTKYPTKLLSDPKEFKDNLDKYDLDDLVRCINKNAKVFDKI